MDTKELATQILNRAARNVWEQMGHDKNDLPDVTPGKLRAWLSNTPNEQLTVLLHKFMIEGQGIAPKTLLSQMPKESEPDGWQQKICYRIRRCTIQHAIDIPIQHRNVETLEVHTSGMSNLDSSMFEKVNDEETKPRLIADTAMIAVLSGWDDNEELFYFKQMAGIGNLTDGMVAIHNLWKAVNKEHKDEFYHPIEPIVTAYLECYLLNNAPTEAVETRQNQIAPAFLKKSLITTKERLPVGTFHQQGNVITQLHLPIFENTEDNCIIHALPLELYEGQQGGGRGAPLDERIFFNALLACPYGKPEPFNAIRLAPTLRDYKDWLYPNGWNRTLQLPRLQKALYEVHNKRISYERRSWNIVQVLAMPEQTTQMDDPLPLIIRLPDGVKGNGPLIDVHRLRLYGLESAPKWRAWIRLHYLWDTAKQRNGGYPIYATIPKVKQNTEGYLLNARGDIITSGAPYKTTKGRWAAKNGGEPQTAWYHPWAIRLGETRNPNIDKIPVLTDKALVALFFDNAEVDNNTFRQRGFVAKNAAMDMEADNTILIERDAFDTRKGIKGWRIVPIYLENV